LFSKQHNRIDLLHLIVAPLLGDGWQHDNSTKNKEGRLYQ